MIEVMIEARSEQRIKKIDLRKKDTSL